MCHHPIGGPQKGAQHWGCTQAIGPQDTIEAHGSKGPSDGVVGGDRVPVSCLAGAAAQVTAGVGSPPPEVLPEGDKNVMVEEMATGNPAALIGPAGGMFSSTIAADAAAAVDESGAILGHPMLRAPEDVSLDVAMGMVHWALTQAHNVLRRESVEASTMNSDACCCGLPCSWSGQR
jgi:hypothetical protein